MPKAKTRRGYTQMDTNEIIKVLENFGWEARRGKGSHTVMTKAERPILTLPARLAKNTALQVQRELGVDLDELVPKKRGRTVSAGEFRRRLELAANLWRAQCSSNYIKKNCGLSNLSESTGYTPELHDSLSVDEIMERYVHPFVASHKTRGPKPDRPEHEQPGPVIVHRPAVEPSHEAVVVSPDPVEKSTLPIPAGVVEHGDLDAMLNILGEINDSIKESISGKLNLNMKYHDRLIVTRRRLVAVQQKWQEVSTELDRILDDLREYQ